MRRRNNSCRIVARVSRWLVVVRNGNPARKPQAIFRSECSQYECRGGLVRYFFAAAETASAQGLEDYLAEFQTIHKATGSTSRGENCLREDWTAFAIKDARAARYTGPSAQLEFPLGAPGEAV